MGKLGGGLELKVLWMLYFNVVRIGVGFVMWEMLFNVYFMCLFIIFCVLRIVIVWFGFSGGVCL